MSLDVYLYGQAENMICSECGHIRPVQDCIFSSNITHNLGEMAGQAGIYEYLWHPERVGATQAKHLIGPLEEGLLLLKSDRAKFEQFNAKNGWGKYEHFVPWVEEYLKACKYNPEAEIKVSR